MVIVLVAISRRPTVSTKIPTNGERKVFIPHPAGRHLAVCSDVFLLEEKNYFFGKKDQQGKIDERRTVTNLHIAFLTDNLTADGKPGYVSQKFSASGNEKSKLVKFIIGWLPELTGANFWELDYDKLIGKTAEITTNIRPNKNDPTHPGYSEIVVALAPRKGDVCPAIPADFKRTDVVARQAKIDEWLAKDSGDLDPWAVPTPAAPVAAPTPRTFVDDDDLPFG
jgi:hypothetical protein